MTAVLPTATTRVIATGGNVATGVNLATIWGCCPRNADKTPRIWADANALETFHGPGQLLDHVSLYIRITTRPALVVPLPIGTPGIITWQKQAGTGTGTPSVSVGPDGSLELVDGLLRVNRGGIIGTDQIQLGYSLDAGNSWTDFRLGTATSYTIARIGHVLSFTAGLSLVTGEEVLSWASTAPTPTDADIAEARANLAAQGNQSRAWYLIRELTKEQDLSAYATAVETYDVTDKRPLQASAGIRRAYDRSKYKAQLSQVRYAMTGSPSITFVVGAGPPGDSLTRDTGSFVDDGFVAGDWVTISGASEAANNGHLLTFGVSVTQLTFPAAGAGTFVADTDPSGVSIVASPGLVFVDGGGSDDTLGRSQGSWTDEGFAVGDTITIAGTASNDGAYVITDLSASTITVATGSFTDEEISSWGVTITASVLYAVDVAAMDAAFATVTNQYKLELSYGHLWNTSPTTLMRLRYPVAFVDMCRSFLPARDLAETTWEQGFGALAGPEGWGMTDVNGQPFEYDERITRAALAAEFTCARTHEEVDGIVPYIARSLTRRGGGDALTRSEAARPTNLGRRIIQVTTKQLTGAVFTKRPPNGQGQRFLSGQAIAAIETKNNQALVRQMRGNTRGGRGPRVNDVTWVASRDDDFSVPNPKLTGKLTIDTLGVVVSVDTAVEVF